MTTNGMGKARYGGGGGKTAVYSKTFRLQSPNEKAGETVARNVFRLLPPMKSLATQGTWAVYQGVHYGYRGRDRNDPEQLKARPFKCVEQKRHNTVYVECPECKKITSQKTLLEMGVEQDVAARRPASEIEFNHAQLKDWLQKHNLDRKWHIAAINEAGEFGVLLLPHRTYKALEMKIGDLVAKGLDPLAPDQGVWFDFRRSGRGINVTDTVEVMTETYRGTDGGFGERYKDARLTELQCQQALEIIPELNDTVTALSVEQVAMLANSSGDPDEVDSVFGLSQKRREGSPAPKPNPAQVAAAAPTPPAEKTALPWEAQPADDAAARIAALEAQLAAAKAASSQPTAPPPATAATGTPSSDEEFLAMFRPSN